MPNIEQKVLPNNSQSDSRATARNLIVAYLRQIFRECGFDVMQRVSIGPAPLGRFRNSMLEPKKKVQRGLQTSSGAVERAGAATLMA
jgi:hypothetical protein